MEKISKDELTKILDGLALQTIWISMCIDELDALQEIGNDRIKIAKNFFYITHSSLIYRYSMEIAKLFDDGDVLSIYRIRNICLKHKEYFSVDITEYCKKFKDELKKYNETIINIQNRRNKTYAHNDKEYYLFKKRAIQDNPLDYEAIKKLADLLYYFAKTMQEKINSCRKEQGYPANTDDVKRLFRLKTKDDLWLEETD